MSLPGNRFVAIACLLMASCAFGQSTGRATAPRARQDAAIVKDFQSRVTKYMDLRRKEAGKSPKPTTSTDKLADSREQIAGSIRVVRAAARQGEIFAPPIARYFRRRIAATLAGPQGKAIRASLRHAEPLRGVSLKVNERYPAGAPLQSTPPSLLLNLPELPKELEYRIVGSDLVLLDTAPNIIVDFIPNVFPKS